MDHLSDFITLSVDIAPPLFFNQAYNKGFELAKKGGNKFPNDIALQRVRKNTF